MLEPDGLFDVADGQLDNDVVRVEPVDGDRFTIEVGRTGPTPVV